MSIVAPHIANLTKAGGMGEDWPTDAIAGLLSISDVWPGDKFVVQGGIVIELEGTAHWLITSTQTGESHRTRPPGYFAK